MNYRKLLKSLTFFMALPISVAAQDGSFDATFNQGAGCPGTIYKMQVQTDDKIIIAGDYNQYDGVTMPYLSRLNANGTLDTGFDTGSGPDRSVYNTVLQPDGKLIIVGNFNEYNGTPSRRIARINSDGSYDTTFNVGVGANDDIFALARQADGMILIGGYLSSYNGTSRNRIARLNLDGSLDTTFNIGTGANNEVYDIVVQPDGKIVIAGFFTMFNGTTQTRIARLNANGSLDTTFILGATLNSEVRTVAVQADGKLVIGGLFNENSGSSRNFIMRLHADGSLDSSFNIGTGTDGNVYDIVIQQDTKILVTGLFSSFNGTARSGVVRLLANGNLDSTFDPGTGLFGSFQTGLTMGLQSDEKLIVGGDFTEYNGQPVGSIVRIANTVLSVATVEENAIAFFPNPTNGELHFNLYDATSADIKIYDMKGQLVQRDTVFAANATIMINGDSGLYLMEICQPNGVKIYRKLIKR